MMFFTYTERFWSMLEGITSFSLNPCLRLHISRIGCCIQLVLSLLGNLQNQNTPASHWPAQES